MIRVLLNKKLKKKLEQVTKKDFSLIGTSKEKGSWLKKTFVSRQERRSTIVLIYMFDLLVNENKKTIEIPTFISYFQEGNMKYVLEYMYEKGYVSKEKLNISGNSYQYWLIEKGIRKVEHSVLFWLEERKILFGGTSAVLVGAFLSNIDRIPALINYVISLL